MHENARKIVNEVIFLSGKEALILYVLYRCGAVNEEKAITRDEIRQRIARILGIEVWKVFNTKSKLASLKRRGLICTVRGENGKARYYINTNKFKEYIETLFSLVSLFTESPQKGKS